MRYKRLLLGLTALALALVLSACGGTKEASAPSGVDVDLTAMSSTMVYAEVYNMLSAPEEYLGKTVRMRGTCMIFQDDESSPMYYTCYIQDALACCSGGLEFELVKGQTYPREDDEITVVGTFDTYDEGDFTYCTLRNAYLV